MKVYEHIRNSAPIMSEIIVSIESHRCQEEGTEEFIEEGEEEAEAEEDEEAEEEELPSVQHFNIFNNNNNNNNNNSNNCFDQLLPLVCQQTAGAERFSELTGRASQAIFWREPTRGIQLTHVLGPAHLLFRALLNVTLGIKTISFKYC